MKYYVYLYLNPEISGDFIYDSIKLDYEPFYVGKGTGKRCYYHVMDSKRNLESNNPFYNKIKQLKSIGINPEIRIIKYFDSSEDAYNYETDLIKKIGSNYINEIKNGPLKNTCLIAQPPNHKGKTYEEIYGDNAEEQKRIRREKQLAVGGYFKNHKHSEESKFKTSQKMKGKLTRPMTDQIKKNISISKKANKRLGRNCKNSKSYFITDPFGIKYEVIGKYEINKFAKENNISTGSLEKTLRYNVDLVKGKTKGWRLHYQNENSE